MKAHEPEIVALPCPYYRVISLRQLIILVGRVRVSLQLSMPRKYSKVDNLKELSICNIMCLLCSMHVIVMYFKPLILRWIKPPKLKYLSKQTTVMTLIDERHIIGLFESNKKPLLGFNNSDFLSILTMR